MITAAEEDGKIIAGKVRTRTGDWIYSSGIQQ
jgi:hypothetical protein